MIRLPMPSQIDGHDSQVSHGYGFRIQKVLAITAARTNSCADVILSDGTMALVGRTSDIKVGQTVLGAPEGIGLEMCRTDVADEARKSGFLVNIDEPEGQECPYVLDHTKLTPDFTYDTVLIGRCGHDETSNSFLLNGRPFDKDAFEKLFPNHDKMERKAIEKQIKAIRFSRLVTPPMFLPSILSRDALAKVFVMKGLSS